MENNIVLEAKAIDKNFGNVQALNNVDFSLRKGVILGLIGENGSGKSTLSSIIAGVQPASGGEMTYKGEKYEPANALEANEKGICMLLQERGTFSGIPVAANIFAGKESRFIKRKILNISKMNQAGKEALKNIGADFIDETAVTGTLTFEEQKLVEIARAMEQEPEILIVDETTTALSRKGRDILYDLIKRMKKHGKSVIFISHDIDEVMEICDFITILRDGKKIDTMEKKNFSEHKIRQLMVGREMNDHFYRADNHATREEELAIQMENVSCGILKNVDLKIYKGEIVGIGGLTDCGMHDIGRLLFGVSRPSEGRVLLGNGTEIKNTRVATRNMIGYVEKDRDKEALMTSSSIQDNICAPSLRKLQKHGFITKKAERKFSNQWADELKVKMSGIDQLVMQLSGGNKQKVSVAKWLGYDADILVFDCPTRGIDVGVKAAIYQLLMELKSKGKAIVMISEELMEVIGMSDRIVVIKDGCVSGEFKRDDMLTESKLIEYII